MYFNRRVLTSIAVISSIGLVDAGNCPQSVVDAVSDAGFLKFALLNCIPVTRVVGGAGVNRLGKPTLDPQTCLATFTANTNVSFGPATCVGTYSGFVRDIVSGIQTLAYKSPYEAVAAVAHDPCIYDATNDQLLVSYMCWNKLSFYLNDFQQKAGYPIQTGSCDGSFIRSQSLAKTFQAAVTKTLASLSDGTAVTYKSADYRAAAAAADGINHIVVGKWAKNSANLYKANGVDLELAMCYGAYQTLFDVLQGNNVISVLTPPFGVDSFGTPAAGPTGWISSGVPMTALQTACQADVSSAVCSNSQLISGMKALFNELSGYDITFTGPLCDAGTISKVDSSTLTPTPYQFFVMCGLMASTYPSECSSSSISQYVDYLASNVGTECNGCYQEMYSLISTFVTNSTAMSVCNSMANITSDACVAAMSPIAAEFKSCTGSDLYTKIPSSIPAPSNTSGSNTTTNGTATNDAASKVFINSGIVIVAAVLTYLI